MRKPKEPARDQITLTEVMHALSDPARLEVAVHLADAGEQACGQCGIDMPKSSLSHHFKVLRDAGVITTRIDGTRHINAVRTADLNARFPGLLTAILRAACRTRK